MPERVVIAAPAIVPPTYMSYNIAIKIGRMFEKNGLQVKFLPGPLANRVSFLISLDDVEMDLACFSEDTKILTKAGFIPIAEITKNSVVATVNKNREIEYHKPIALQRYHYTGKMVHIKNHRNDLLVTPDHQMYFSDYYAQSSEFKHYPARILPKSKSASGKFQQRWQMMTWLKPQNCLGIETVSIPEIPQPKREDQFHSKTYGPFEIEDWLKFLGWFLSEGYAGTKKEKHSTRFRFHIAQNRNSPYRNEIKYLLSRMGFKFYESDDGFEVTSKQVTSFLLKFGKAQDKFIPRWIFELPHHQLRLLLDTLVKGDGHIKHRNLFYYTTTSKQLAEDIQELALRCGLWATRSKKQKNNCYIITITDSKRDTIIAKEPNLVDYSGIVCDLTVPNHTVIAKRNGKISITGQCYLGHGSPYSLCIHPESSLVLKNGTISAKNVEEGQEVLTHKGRMRKVTHKFSRQYKGPMYRIKVTGCNEPMLVTPEHPILISNENDSEIFLRADKLEKGMKVAYPRVKQESSPVSKIMPEHYLKADYIAHDKDRVWFINKHNGRRQFSCQFMPKEIQITPDLMRLFGYYIAEGHSSNGNIGFSFNSNEDKYLTDVELLMKKYFHIEGTRYEKEFSECTQLMFRSSILSEFLETFFGTNARNKQFPDWFLDYTTDDKLKSLITGYWRGDGTYDKDRRTIRFGTVSRNLAFGIRNILSRLGISSNIHKYPPCAKTIQGREVNFAKWTYEIQCGGTHADNLANILGIKLRERKRHSGWKQSTISNDYLNLRIREIEIFDYEGEVLNFEVEEDNTYVLTSGIVHNCMESVICESGFTMNDVSWLAGKILCAAPACEVGQFFAPKMIETGGKAALASVEPMYAAFAEDEHNYLEDWHDYTIELYRVMMDGTVGEAYNAYQEKCSFYLEKYKSKTDVWPNAEWYWNSVQRNRDDFMLFGDPNAKIEYTPSKRERNIIEEILLSLF